MNRMFWWRPLLEEDKGGAGGSGGKTELEKLKEENARLLDENKKLKDKPDPDDKEDDDEEEDDQEDEKKKSLNDKVNKNKKDKEAKDRDQRRMERAIEFNLGAANFVKEHKDILPSECEELVKAAETEKYDSQIEKTNAIKSAIIQSFFQVQANVDLLTASQKKALDDYLKLTKTGKEEKADHIFENIFEPSLESTKRIKKAEDMNKSRSGVQGSQSEKDYMKRLVDGSRKHYLREKK